MSNDYAYFIIKLLMECVRIVLNYLRVEVI